MARPRHLSNAPISEAIFDFRVKARPSFDPVSFLSLKAELLQQFPKAVERRGFRAAFSTQGPAPELQDLGVQGVFFSTDDDRTVAQFRLDGFTLNRLHPYTSWEDLYPRVINLWHRYGDVAQPEFLARIALRYLNRITLSGTTAELGRYLSHPPELPPEIPHRIRRFVTRVTVDSPVDGTAAHVTQTLEPGAEPSRLTLVLDIDAFHEERLDADDSRIPVVLERLRTFKNQIFFSLITEATAEMFE